MSNKSLYTMSKQELRDKMAADAEKWIQENGKPDLYAAVSSPREHFAICGYSMKRKPLKQRDVRQENYEAWLQEVKG